MGGVPQEEELVREIVQLQQIVQAVCDDARLARSKHLAVKTMLEEYQEQPQLLDPHLESLVTPLAVLLSEASLHLGDEQRFAATMQVCRLLQALVNTRGHKTIVRFFPNKPPDLERAVALLRHMQGMTICYEVDEDAQDGSWQTRCAILLWLSSLVLIPFDISTVQVSDAALGRGSDTQQESAVSWLIRTATSYLSDSGATRCAALQSSISCTTSRMHATA
jgi:tubulin-specific chaperone D